MGFIVNQSGCFGSIVRNGLSCADAGRWTRKVHEEIEICRKAEISEAAYYNWRKKYGA
jgi:Transposase